MISNVFTRAAFLALVTAAIAFAKPASPAGAALRPAMAPAQIAAAPGSRAARPLSLAWRKEWMLRHGFVNHAGAAGLLPPLSDGKYLYVADYDLSVIFVYDAKSTTNPAPLGFIADGVSYPAAIAFDRADNLYVANEGTSTITVYRRGSTRIAKTIATIFPFALAFGTDGTLYVSGNDAHVGNEIEIFSPKSTKPGFIPTPMGDQSDGLTVDPNNILTVTVNNGNQNGYIYTYPNGLQNPVQVTGSIGMLNGLAYDSPRRLYVAAYNSNQVFVYAPPAWGTYQTISNGIARPIGLSFDSSRLYVANSTVPSVTSYAGIGASPVTYDNSMTFVTAAVISGRGPATPVEHSLYFTQECNCSEVDVYDANLKSLKKKATYTQGVHTANGLWVDDAGNLWVANNGTHVVTELSAKTHAPIRFLSLNRPYSVAVDHAGTVYVADQANNDIAAFSPGSNSPSRILDGCSGGRVPQYMTVDPANNLYVTCGGDVIIYAPGATTGHALNLSGLTYAFGVALDAQMNLYVADYLGNAVNVYVPNTTVPSRVITSGVNIPSQIAIGASGRLYVANLSGNRASIYAPGGNVPIGTIPGNFEGVATGP